MKKCKYCQSEIDAKAKICPNCKKKQGPKIFRWILLGILALMIIGGIIASQEEKARQKEFKQNEIATYKEVEYSITTVERTQGNEYFEAKEGKEYIVISLKIENKSSDKISYNALDWKMEDGTGDENDYAIWGNNNNTHLSSGDLNKGGTKTGTIAFEIPKGDKNITLKYYDTILNNERAFEFKIED